MNAFTWHAPTTPGTLPLLQSIPPDAAPNKVPRRALETRRAYKRVETEPGMDKFAENVGKLGQTALEPLLEWSRAVIPRNSWPTTPVFLLGTAGLRKLNENDRERVMNEARSVLMRCGFRFEPSWARVLGGNDEGIFAWVALNAAEGKLGTKDTLGALDLGGSSLQVTFALDGEDTSDGNASSTIEKEKESSRLTSPSSVNISLLGTQHSLYTHSHYHYGLEDAFERSVSILLEEKNGHNRSGNGTAGKRRRSRDLLLDNNTDSGNLIEVEHPCLHKGYNQKYNRIPLEGRIPSPSTVILIGKPDTSACSRLATSVVTSPTECHAPPCALGHPQPRATGKFIALAGFYVVSHFFNLGANARVAAVAKAGQSFCPLTWSEVQSRHPGEMAVETYCFRTAYIEALTFQGLGLKEDQVEIGQGTAGWTLGAALVEGHRHAGLGGGGGGGGGKIAEGGGSRKYKTTSNSNSNSSKLSGVVSHWAGNIPLPPSWGGRAAACVLAVFILAALVLAYRRGKDAVARSLRAQGWIEQPRRRSSSGILSAAEFGSQELSNSGSGGNGNGNIFFRFFGAAANTNGKKASPSSQQPGTSSENGSLSTAGSYGSLGLSAVGSARALGLTRSATYSRRLSALESASSERG
jgi:Golgi nucleoside diphosphatase